MKNIYNKLCHIGNQRLRRGFTLTEMLTVVLIVGILVSIAIPQYRRTIRRSRINEAIAMLDVLAKTSERLMISKGYKTLTALNAAKEFSFKRVDMLDTNTLPCSVSSTEVNCEDFTYTYGADTNGFYLQAKQKATDALLKLYPDRWSTHDDYITCSCETATKGCDSDLCALYGYPYK